jgi:hypothetical protein
MEFAKPQSGEMVHGDARTRVRRWRHFETAVDRCRERCRRRLSYAVDTRLRPLYEGRITTTGRSFGSHGLAPGGCSAVLGRDAVQIVLSSWFDGGRSRLTIWIAPESSTRRFEVDFPWTHVFIRPADCSKIDISVQRDTEVGFGFRGVNQR